jgi:hypothetical protein
MDIGGTGCSEDLGSDFDVLLNPPSGSYELTRETITAKARAPGNIGDGITASRCSENFLG